MDRLASKETGKDLENSIGEDAGQQEEVPLPREVYALLAQANLLRMRGHWDEAAQCCMTALRQAPDSSSANSLLGDIYENQGRYDDAAQWYRMALDANPDSPADHLKLDRLRLREGSQRGQNPPSQAHNIGAAPEVRTVPVAGSGGLPRLLRDPETALRIGAIAAALVLLLIIAFAYRAAHTSGTFSALGLGGDAVVKSSPVVVPPVAGTLPSDPDAAPAYDSAEQSLLTALQAAPDLSRQNITVYAVQADPRTRRMAITFGLPPSAGLTQAEVVHSALRVLQTASSAQPLEAYTARCLLIPPAEAPSPGAGAAASLVFVGDASLDAVQSSAAAGTGLTDAQAEAVFTNVWWSSTADIRI